MDKWKLLVEYNTQDVIAYIAEEKKMGMAEAMRLFYLSDVYTKLNDKETGLYLEGAAYIYDLLENELRNGQIQQEEI